MRKLIRRLRMRPALAEAARRRSEAAYRTANFRWLLSVHCPEALKMTALDARLHLNREFGMRIPEGCNGTEFLNHTLPALFAHHDELKRTTRILASMTFPPLSIPDRQLWLDTSTKPPTCRRYDAGTDSWRVAE